MVKASLTLAALLFAAMQNAPVSGGNFSAELVAYDDSRVIGYTDNQPGAVCQHDFEFHGTIANSRTGSGYDGRYRWRSMGGIGPEQGFSIGEAENDVSLKLVVPVKVALGGSAIVTAQIEVTGPEHVYSPEMTLTYACRPKR
jgi:hypothetical protein